jgi:hypothetical protein
MGGAVQRQDGDQATAGSTQLKSECGLSVVTAQDHKRPPRVARLRLGWKTMPQSYGQRTSSMSMRHSSGANASNSAWATSGSAWW